MKQEARGVSGGVLQIMLAVVVVAAVMATATGLFDPPLVNECVTFDSQANFSLAINSYSQIQTFNLPPDIRSLQIRMTGTPAEADFDAILTSGPLNLSINPVGYAGVTPMIELAPFPHVGRPTNDISIVFGASREITEIWINRELFWRGSIAAEETLSVAVKNYRDSIDFDLAVCILTDG